MKTLLIGLGQIGLGLINPVFKSAGYDIVGTDADVTRLNDLKSGYLLETPGGFSQCAIKTASMEDITSDFDLVVTSVGRKHLDKVAEWYKSKNFSAPVLLAENLPDLANFFPVQIPIVVDRRCPRIVRRDNALSVTAEDYYKIVVLRHALTRPLGTIHGVDLEKSKKIVEMRRRQKMFTVNTSHVVTALYGQKLGYSFVEEAVQNKEIQTRIGAVVAEVGPWLNLSPKEVVAKEQEIIMRFSSPLRDSLARILPTGSQKSASRYLEIPLQGVHSIGLKAPVIEEALNLLNT